MKKRSAGLHYMPRTKRTGTKTAKASNVLGAQAEGIVVTSEKPDEQDSKIVLTRCPKCGDVWTTRAVAPTGKCPVCGGKVKVQKVVF